MTLQEIKSNNEFQDLIYDNMFAIVELYVPSSNACQSIAPNFEGFSEGLSDIAVGKVNIEEVPDVAAEYGVDDTPTFLYFNKGYKVDEYSGTRIDIIKEKINCFYYCD